MVLLSLKANKTMHLFPGELVLKFKYKVFQTLTVHGVPVQGVWRQSKNWPVLVLALLDVLFVLANFLINAEHQSKEGSVVPPVY